MNVFFLSGLNDVSYRSLVFLEIGLKLVLKLTVNVQRKTPMILLLLSQGPEFLRENAKL